QRSEFRRQFRSQLQYCPLQIRSNGVHAGSLDSKRCCKDLMRTARPEEGCSIVVKDIALLLRRKKSSGIDPLDGARATDCCVRLAWSYSRKDRKSTRLNSSHVAISYAVFCLKKKKK